MQVYLTLLLLPLLYLTFVLSGFIHERGHATEADWAGIDVKGLSPSECIRLQCRVNPLEPLEGWRGLAVLLGGGLFAALWWLATYLVTMRWHRTGGWWVGGVIAAFFTGELTAATLEGGMNWLDSDYVPVALLVIVFGMAAGFRAHMKIMPQSFRIRQISDWLKGSQKSTP